MSQSEESEESIELPQHDQRNNNQHQDEQQGKQRGRTGEFEPNIVFVGNLDYGTTWQRLKDLFREAGPVRFADLIAASDGRPKGSAIVTFENAAGAEAAVKMFHDTEFDGRRVLVRKYESGRRPVLVDTKKQRQAEGGNRNRRRGNRNRNRGSGGGGGGGGGNMMKRGGGDNQDSESRDAEEMDPNLRDDRRDMPRPRSVQARQDGKLFISNLPFQCTSQGLRDTFSQVGRVTHAEIITSSNGRSRGMGLVEFATSREAKLAIEEFDGIAMAGRPMSVRFERP